MRRFKFVTHLIFIVFIICNVFNYNFAETEKWRLFKGNGFELYLPQSWEGACEEEFDLVIGFLKVIGQEAMATQIKESPPSFFAYDSNFVMEEGSILTNIIISKETAYFLSLDKYMERASKAIEIYEEELSKSGISIDILEQKVVSLGKHPEVGRIIMKQTFLDLEMKQVQYIIKSRINFWIVSITTGPRIFDNSLPTFDRIVERFTIKK